MVDVLYIGSAVELEHLSYANPFRGLNNVGGHSVEVIAENQLDDLYSHLGQIKTLVVGSNALRSRHFRESLLSGPLQDSFERFLSEGGGLLILHQLGRGESDAIDLGFLPHHLGAVAVHRPPDESPKAGELRESNAKHHEALLLPTGINLSAISESLLGSGPNGLYWHWWAPAEPDRWQSVIEDGPTGRPLVIEYLSKRQGGRIILCSLPLDWITDRSLFSNLIHLTATGNLDVAMVRAEEDSSMELVDIRTELEVAGFATLIYATADESLARLESSLRQGMHRTLILNEGVIATSSPLWTVVHERVAEGSLRVVALPRVRNEPLQVWTSETRFSDEWQRLQMAFLVRLARGGEDLGLWNMAEGLWATRLTEAHAERCRELAKTLGPRIKNGSVDNTAGPTAMYVWLLSEANSSAKESLGWLRERLPQQKPGDTLRIGYWLNRAGALDEGLSALCDKALAELSVTDSPQDLLAALVFATERVHHDLDRITELACGVQPEHWGLGSTRSDMLVCLMNIATLDRPSHSSLLRQIALKAASLRASYLADGQEFSVAKLKAAYALSAYEREHALPTKGALTAVMGDSDRERGLASGWSPENMASFTRDLRSEIAKEISETSRWRRRAELTRIAGASHRPIIAGLVVLLYVFIAALTGSQVGQENPLSDIWDGIWSYREIHVSIMLALIGGLFAWIRTTARKTNSPDGGEG